MGVIFHVDLDAFYASVEQIDNPELQGKAVIVGALPGHRGVVSSCSYEARRFGVRSAMPISQALRRCAKGVFLPVRMKRYVQVSQTVMRTLESFTPEFQQISIDEAFMDMSGTERLYGPPLQAGKRVKERVQTATGLTLSIGIAANRYLAKLASEYSKPDGLHFVQAGQEISFLDGLTLGKLWGVGEKTRERLSELNISSVESLRSFPLDILCSMMGDASGRYLYRACRGEDPGIFAASPKSHSVSSEMTFEKDIKNADTLKRNILELSEQVMHRLLIDNLRTNTVVLKLRFFDFVTTTAQKTVKHWITSSDEIYQLAQELLAQRWNGSTPVRLIGVGTANVVAPGQAIQGELFAEDLDKRRKVEETVTHLRQKMKGVKLTKASLIDRES
ncbi:MAG: DNA polymerase IV [Spirochaetaceae bacterium]|nr:MAG: DNA polymerase IV [Spirochaetaceae bacterium]